MKTILFYFLLLIPILSNAQEIDLPTGKFHTGDDIRWKNTNADDSEWAVISTQTRWEKQGFADYNGYAWYRFKFTLPKSMKQKAYLKDTLSILMSKIDDADETYLNGTLIGKTGSFPSDKGGFIGKWSTERIYNIPSESDFIRWGEENTIAVRVYDKSDGGGIYGASPRIKLKEPIDAILIALDKDTGDENYYGTLSNTSANPVEGIWEMKVTDPETHRIVQAQNKMISLLPQKMFTHIIKPAVIGKSLAISWSFKEIHQGTKKTAVKFSPYILTPPVSAKPHINSPGVFGVGTGSPFLFRIAATGTKPLKFEANQLPDGLTINKNTGIITGEVKTKGDYRVSVQVSNKLATAKQVLIIKVGGKLALTPPMGWNSWNCWAMNVSEDKIRRSAEAFVNKGLTDHGWSYINIDDGWPSEARDSAGVLMPNLKFADMAALGTFLHDKGLKFGIYSSPGPLTCGGSLGSFQHELKDATIYAKWGVDYLKYDWCSYEDKVIGDTAVHSFSAPYKLMQSALKAQSRDIIYSLCQYGLKQVWKWGDSVGGNSWRTSDDIKDNWQSLKETGFAEAPLYPFAKPGNWNDPDMLMVGRIGGWWGGKIHQTSLTPDEQYTHISLWCMLSAPLLIGSDLDSLDNFTLSLLTNDEVLAIDQDTLGKQGIQKVKTDKCQIWVKELSDGSHAVAMFNMSGKYSVIDLKFTQTGLPSKIHIRDLWRQKNEGIFSGNYQAKIPPHGVKLIKVTKNKISDRE